MGGRINKFGASAIARARELQELIDTLNNTTVATLNSDIESNADAISDINTAISNINTSIGSINDTLDALGNKLDAIASLFGIVFNGDGTLSSENYSSHTHEYSDKFILDTDDGSGTAESETKTTQGVS